MVENFYIDLLDINDFIIKGGLQPVLSSSLYSRNSSEPDPDGLLSYKIFGMPGTDARRFTYGYIDLNAKFVHPKVYKDLITLKREIYRDIINGVGAFTVEDGELKRVISETGSMNIEKGSKVGTGIDFLYSVWDKLSFKITPDTAQQTKEIKEFLSLLKKDEVFITKWLVMPAFYRDVDLRTNRRNEYNAYYIKLIEYASMIKASSAMFQIFSTTDAHRKIQATLNDIYNQFVLNRIGGSKGFIQNSVIGKTTEYSARLVISAADFNSASPKDTECSFTHSAVPLFAVLKIFLPFISYGLKQFFKTYLGSSNFIFSRDPKTGKQIRHEIDPTFEDILSVKNLQKLVTRFEESKYQRIMPVTIRTVDKQDIPIAYFTGENVLNTAVGTDDGWLAEHKYDFCRPLNWTELFYIIAQDTVSDKVCYITRYPIEDYNSIYPTFINIIPSKLHKKLRLENGRYYPRFPDFSNIKRKEIREVPQSVLNTLFPDTLRLFPAYLAQLKADYDGSSLVA